MNHLTKQALVLEFTQYAGARIFTMIMIMIMIMVGSQACLADSERTVHELNGLVQRKGARADGVASLFRRPADFHQDLVIQYPRFARTGFLALCVGLLDSGLCIGYLFGRLGTLNAELSFLKDLSEINVSWCGSFAALMDRFAQMATKPEASRNDGVEMKGVLEWRHSLAGSEICPVLLILHGVCGVGENGLSPVFEGDDLFFLEGQWVTSSCICSKCRSVALWRIENTACECQLACLKVIEMQLDSLAMEHASTKAILQILQKKAISALDRGACLRSWVNLLVDAIPPDTTDVDFRFLPLFMRNFAVSRMGFHGAKVNRAVKISLISVVNRSIDQGVVLCRARDAAFHPLKLLMSV
jgi:hypothetical protein